MWDNFGVVGQISCFSFICPPKARNVTYINVSGKAFRTMKHIARILTTLLLAGIFTSFDTFETKLKDGYYTSSHGHVTVLYKIDGYNIEWYRDNVIKSWGQGKFEIIQTDSVMKISVQFIGG